MFHATDDLRIAQLRPLIPPAILMEELPLTEEISTVIASARDAATRIVRGDDDRLLVVVGPCSIHDPVAAREYATRLVEVRERLIEDLCIVMRVYFEKPRTTVGWKGLINDPGLDGSFDINTGLRTARRLLVEVRPEVGHQALAHGVARVRLLFDEEHPAALRRQRRRSRATARAATDDDHVVAARVRGHGWRR